MLFIISFICIVSGIYYYNINKNFKLFVKNHEQYIYKTFQKNIKYMLENTDNNQTELISQINEMQNKNKKETFIKKNNLMNENLETIIEINESDEDTDESIDDNQILDEYIMSENSNNSDIIELSNSPTYLSKLPIIGRFYSFSNIEHKNKS